MLSDIDGFDTEGRALLLEIIDKLRKLGISESVSLPQLVVVGDQSSGKSSVLEGMTGFCFPVASDLCTRFVTQIVLIRAPESDAGVRVTVIPGPTTQMDDEYKAHLLGFERRMAEDDFGSDDLRRIFNEAAKHMGVPGPDTEDPKNLDKRFSDDILRIEIFGPQHQNLSVVDVPGLFHNPTDDQTEEDRETIRKLIKSYLNDKRTIILAVMDARNNFANQEVFSMAQAADPAGVRTVGIITKCDALEPGDEGRVLKIARNEVERLTHVWFAVRNRSTKDIKDGMTIEGRHKKEIEFFSSVSPWNTLRADRVGIKPLKVFLGQLLYAHIRGEFPGVVKDIEDFLRNARRELEQLGPSRQTAPDQRRYLTQIAAKYERDVLNALSGSYGSTLEPDSILKLRMHIRNLNDKFAESMARDGHTKIFQNLDGGQDKEYQRPWCPEDDDIYDWIRKLYRDSRGAELPGMVNPSVLEDMFRQQTVAWEPIATKYIDKVAKAVHVFNQTIFDKLIGDEEVKDHLSARLREQNREAVNRAAYELTNLLQVNNYFAETLSNIREERTFQRLKAKGFRDGGYLSLKQVVGAVHLSNEDQAVENIHDILKAYYKVARKRFSDNVILQVAERHLLGANGPVSTLSPEFIMNLEDSELEHIASESYVTSSKRNDLASKVDRFQKALQIATSANIQVAAKDQP
ncbi:dynamin-like protein [Aspergillus novofumigatus IBT 16806]|uniref:P-loop containing nucleoside triphosphate hydrolase protein n=1 Tax=Aspergillus novofumigatus (strain IBT 16806) TaxID=1392255 RepID=A0A2I1CJB1_ASPN1|nr:uncharacterized protein P174DRAFT_458323 [Aspergillus novofumigatus IBT 16806]PKX97711.1 hypothetical protein P174DRAFT_458323 [Aspergillus novofumigatus IBT 16806]